MLNLQAKVTYTEESFPFWTTFRQLKNINQLINSSNTKENRKTYTQEVFSKQLIEQANIHTETVKYILCTDEQTVEVEQMKSYPSKFLQKNIQKQHCRKT